MRDWFDKLNLDEWGKKNIFHTVRNCGVSWEEDGRSDERTETQKPNPHSGEGK